MSSKSEENPDLRLIWQGTDRSACFARRLSGYLCSLARAGVVSGVSPLECSAGVFPADGRRVRFEVLEYRERQNTDADTVSVKLLSGVVPRKRRAAPEWPGNDAGDVHRPIAAVHGASGGYCEGREGCGQARRADLQCRDQNPEGRATVIPPTPPNLLIMNLLVN